MRIAFVTPIYPNLAEPYRGIFNASEAAALSKLAEVEVFCPMSRYPRWLPPETRSYPNGGGLLAMHGLSAHYLPYPALPYLTRPVNAWNSSRKLLPALRAFGPDLIFASWVFPEGLGAVEVGEKLGVPVILKASGSDLRAIPDAISRWLTQRALRRADFIITVSEDLRKVALDLGAVPARLRAIRNGCDTTLFHPAVRSAARGKLGIAADAQMVLFVGHLQTGKGVMELLSATKKLQESRRHLQTVVIGEGILAKKVSQAAHVTMLGRRDPSEVSCWMAASNLLCLPSYSEGCPNVVLESLYCGRPVVASNVGGIPELIDPGCGILVPPRNTEQLAAALDAALTRSWDEAAIAVRFGRNWHDVARETMESCQAVISTPLL